MGNHGFYGFARGKERTIPKEGVYQPPYSLDFNGSNQWVSTASLTAVKRFTFSVCLKPLTTSQSTMHVFGKISYFATVQSDFPISMLVVPTADRIDMNIDSGIDFSYDATLSLPLIAGTWNRVCASHDGTKLIMVANGRVATLAASVNINAGSRTWSIARATFENGGGANNSYYKGKMSDFRFYTRGKTIEECLRISYGEVDYEYLHSWYPFTEGSGSVLTDVAAGLNGSLQNSPTWSTDVP